MLSNKIMVCGLHLLLLLRVHRRKLLKRIRIIWVFRVAKGIQWYLMCSHMVVNSCRGSPRVFHGTVNRNKFYSQITQYMPVFKIWSECFHMVAWGYCNTNEYRQILPNIKNSAAFSNIWSTDHYSVDLEVFTSY